MPREALLQANSNHLPLAAEATSKRNRRTVIATERCWPQQVTIGDGAFRQKGMAKERHASDGITS